MARSRAAATAPPSVPLNPGGSVLLADVGPICLPITTRRLTSGRLVPVQGRDRGEGSACQAACQLRGGVGTLHSSIQLLDEQTTCVFSRGQRAGMSQERWT